MRIIQKFGPPLQVSISFNCIALLRGDCFFWRRG